MGERRGSFKIGPAERDERQDVERPDARMNAAMAAQIDVLERNAGERYRGFENLRFIADDGQDAAMVHDIAAPVDEARSAALDGRRGGINRQRSRVLPRGSERSRKAASCLGQRA